MKRGHTGASMGGSIEGRRGRGRCQHPFTQSSQTDNGDGTWSFGCGKCGKSWSDTRPRRNWRKQNSSSEVITRIDPDEVRRRMGLVDDDEDEAV